ncbi:MAG: Sapep family Mn(2+)-dependent dipeptidase [Erysipelotrichaceae bacterium]|nr:Sapep family Mn(2+)-dependent dipeptidase [Erysipelotrichaceae bacterium]
MIDHLKELIAIDSVTFTPGTGQALDYVLKLAASFGFDTVKGDGWGYAQIGRGEEMMMIIGHLDVVPAGNGWDSDPFEAVIKDGNLYGRGVSDDKGPMMAALYAMKDVHDAKIPLQRRVRILFGTAEEAGDWEDIENYKKHEEWPTFGFTPDADFPALYGEKGMLHAMISMPLHHSGFLDVQGGSAPNMVADHAKGQIARDQWIETTGKSAHGSKPETGINAISKLMEKAGQTPLGKWYTQHIGMETDGQSLGIACRDQDSGPLSVNIGQIETKDNRVGFSLDIRYPVTADHQTIIEAIRGKLLPDMRLDVLSHKEPVFMDKRGPVITKLMEAYHEVTHDDSEPMVIGGGTYARAMPNIVAYGPMFPGAETSEHQPNEHMAIKDLEKAREIYKKAIEKLAGE